LIDTYDNIAGAHHAVTVAKEMEAKGERLEYVRLDSGDMAAISKEVRHILDDNGLDYVRILASGGFDEHKIARFLADGAQIDAFAVGTKMGVSADAPYFDIAYKLVRYGDRPVMKLSTGKATLVDKKQVWRSFDEQGAMQRDVIALRDEKVSEGSPLLEPVMAGGRITRPLPTLQAGRDYFQDQFARLPGIYKTLRDPARYPVSLSGGLKELQSQVEQHIRHRELKES
jgi:nicotinate phosphoribosyltransferase